jgi:tetratricopeptide (TPR) repeat protein
VRTAIGESYRKLARYREAEREHRKSLELRRASAYPDPVGRANAMVALARALVPQGMQDEARALLGEARGILESGCDRGEAVLVLVLDDLAGAAMEQGKFSDAADLYRESLGISERLDGPDSDGAGNSRQNLAVALLCLGKSAEARVELRRVLEIMERAGGTEGKWQDSLYTNLGWAEVLEGNTEEGIKLLRRATAICETRYGSHPETASTLSILARALLRARQLPEAEEAARRAVAMHRAASEAPRRHLASALAGLARIRLANGNRADAEELMAETHAMYAALGSTEEAGAAAAELEAMRHAADSRPDSRPDSGSQK